MKLWTVALCLTKMVPWVSHSVISLSTNIIEFQQYTFLVTDSYETITIKNVNREQKIQYMVLC